jgi:hypoxanthine phosphoribosyltransferase
MQFLLQHFQQKNPASIAVASLLFKPAALVHPIKLDYVGFEIEPIFVVGYGLDYDQIGRGLPAIYQLIV